MFNNISAEELAVIITVVTAVVGGGWVLWRFIRGLEKKASSKDQQLHDDKIDKRMDGFQHKQEDLRRDTENELKSLNEKLALERDKLLLRIDYLEKEVDALSAKQASDHSKHDEIISDIREVLSDVRETIAGFGKDFVTRKEFMDRRNRDA